MSSGERYIAALLESKGVDFETERAFPDLRGLAGRPLRFDFFVPSRRLLIEHDGIFHRKPVIERSVLGPSDRSKAEARNAFQKIKEHDRRKAAWCHFNKYRLIRTFNAPVFEFRKTPSIFRKTDFLGNEAPQWEFEETIEQLLNSDDNLYPHGAPLPGGKVLICDHVNKKYRVISESDYRKAENCWSVDGVRWIPKNKWTPSTSA